MEKSVVIYGASGFVGSGLATMLSEDGWRVIGISRKGRGDVAGISTWLTPDQAELRSVDAVVNLAGEPIDQRWTEEKKKAFHESRVGVTDQIVEKISTLPDDERPGVLLNASAVGYYGDRGDEVLEESATKGDGYLADLCADWEAAAEGAKALGTRVVCVRIGVVLGEGGQAFEKLKKVFKSGIGGRLGNGKQWMPWVHVEDLQRAMSFCLSADSISGPVNGTAPEPERNVEFTKKLATAVKRWVFFPVPGMALKIVLGAFGGVLLGSQRAVPAKLQRTDFEFKYEKLEEALNDLIA